MSKYTCIHCEKTFERKFNLERHIQSKHSSLAITKASSSDETSTQDNSHFLQLYLLFFPKTECEITAFYNATRELLKTHSTRSFEILWHFIRCSDLKQLSKLAIFYDGNKIAFDFLLRHLKTLQKEKGLQTIFEKDIAFIIQSLELTKPLQSDIV